MRFLVVLSIVLVICNAQQCSSFIQGEYICSFDDVNSNLGSANNILIEFTSDEKFVVNSNNPDCVKNDEGSYEFAYDEIILHIGSSCSGPVSLFDDNDILRDYTFSSTCDEFSGNIFRDNDTEKGFLSCVLNNDSSNSSSSRNSSSSSSDDSSSSILLVNLLFLLSIILTMI